MYEGASVLSSGEEFRLGRLSTLIRKQKSDEIENSFPEIQKIRDDMKNLPNIDNIAYLSDLKELIFDLQKFYCKRTGRSSRLDLGLYAKLPFQEYVSKVADRMEELAPPSFRKTLEIFSTENVNGYYLYYISSELLFAYDDFLSYIELWNDPDQPSKSEFMAKYQRKACSEWCKMQPDGTPGQYFGNSVRELNGNALWDLPYPKKFVLKTINIGCQTRQESVRYSNFMCEWMKRKIEQMARDEKI